MLLIQGDRNGPTYRIKKLEDDKIIAEAKLDRDAYPDMIKFDPSGNFLSSVYGSWKNKFFQMTHFSSNETGKEMRLFSFPAKERIQLENSIFGLVSLDEETNLSIRNQITGEVIAKTKSTFDPSLFTSEIFYPEFEIAYREKGQFVYLRVKDEIELYSLY